MKIVTFLAALFFATIHFSQSSYNAHPPSELSLEGTRDLTLPSAKIHPLVLPDGRLLVGVADTIYMLGPNGTVQWKYSTQGIPLTSDPAFNFERNEIAIVGYDLFLARLDGTTGKLKWKLGANGRGLFQNVAAYEKGFLVVTNMSGYRENGVPGPDKLDYWGATEKEFWSIGFPAHAELVVAGKRIFGLRRNKGIVRLKELHIPQGAMEKTRSE